MKYFFTLIFLILTKITFAQQNIHICYDNGTSFTYITIPSEPGLIQWSIDGILQNSSSDLMIDWSQYSLGTHIIRAEFISSYGCWAEPVVYYVTILGCDEFDIYIPNAFSPNENGLNDLWFPIAHNYKDIMYWIYDRWGENVFFSHDGKWNGTYKEADCKVGVYVYVVIGIDLYNGIHQFKGNITLIR